MRRAQIPMAYSSGFNPHPRISYANASPTGASTEAEYLEIGLAEVCQPERVREALDAALPPGLDVIEVVAAGSPGAASLTDLLEASRWHVDLVTTPAGVLAGAVATFLASPEVSVARMTKTGLRTFDARAAVRSLEVVGEHELEMVTVHGTPLVRPDDIVSALREVDSRLASDQPPLLLRISQGPLVDDQIRDPLASD